MTKFKSDWLLDCEPRPAQVEALRRSYDGYVTRTAWDGEEFLEPLGHAGSGPATGWGHWLEMRLGKTPLTFNELLLFERDWGFNKALILSPNKFKYTWALEAEQFGVKWPVHVFESSGRAAADKFVRTYGDKKGILVVHYEALRSVETMGLLESWVDDKTYMTADESVLLKNPKSEGTKNAILLGLLCPVTRSMTGKPSPQGVHDLWAQLRFTKALPHMNYFAWRNRYAVMGGWKAKQVVGIKNAEDLDDFLHQETFRATRKKWSTSKEPDFERVRVEMLPRQREHYRQMEEEFLTYVGDEEFVSASQAANKWAKMQQISSGFIYDDHKKPIWLVPFDKTPKFQDLHERLQYISGKVIIIGYFTATLDALWQQLAEFNPAIITNEAAMRRLGVNVEMEKERFNHDKNCRVMLGQERAIKYGHTLRGNPEDPCLDMIYYENSYSLDDRAQSEQRNQGVDNWGQLHVVDYITSEAERRVISALQRKDTLAGLVFEGQEQSVLDLGD